jgi:hypothetical protein
LSTPRTKNHPNGGFFVLAAHSQRSESDQNDHERAPTAARYS